MVGLQSTAIKTQLGPLLNGIEDYDFWQPVKDFPTPEALAFLKKYQARPPPRASMRWAIICRRSLMPTCRCWARR